MLFPMISPRRLCCWLVACSAAALLAPHVSAQSVTIPGRLQALVDGTSAQFQLAYRHDPAEGQRRQEQLNAVVDSWRDATRNDANTQLLADWLRAAMRTSMPGSRTSLPPAPAFDGRAAKVVRAEKEAEVQVVPMFDDKSVGDPFRDDPLDE